jgi:CBS domain-containing protein
MLTVRDIMRTDVVTASIGESPRVLARLLVDEGISGVPVLDAHGRKVVGVVSSTDLVRLAADDRDEHVASTVARTAVARVTDPDADEVEADPYGFFLPEDSPFYGLQLLEQLPESSFDTATVGDIMTPATEWVAPDMRVSDLCGFLVRRRIHRALVIENGELRGIVTSVDVLRAVAEREIAP